MGLHSQSVTIDLHEAGRSIGGFRFSFMFYLTRRISGQPTVCLSGLIPEFLSWPLSGFTLQNGCKPSDVRKHRHKRSRSENKLPSRKATAHRGEIDSGHQRSRLPTRKPLTKEPDDVSGKRLTKAKILVVHRTGFIRSGVLSLIAKSMQFMACGETDEAPMARELFLRHKPHLVLIGLRLTGADGIQLIKEFRSLDPAAAILALSEQADAFSAQRAFRAGARGYLSTRTLPNCSERSMKYQPAART